MPMAIIPTAVRPAATIMSWSLCEPPVPVDGRAVTGAAGAGVTFGASVAGLVGSSVAVAVCVAVSVAVAVCVAVAVSVAVAVCVAVAVSVTVAPARPRRSW